MRYSSFWITICVLQLLFVSAQLCSQSIDLTVFSTNTASSGDAGQTIYAYINLKNLGSDPSGVSTSKIYLSDDGTPDASEEIIAHSHPSIDPGNTNGAWLYALIPSQTPTGTYNLILVADAPDLITETDEGNNVTIKTISITGAPAPYKDLIVNTTNVPTTGDAGQTIWANMTIKNEGNEASGASTSKIYLSDDSIVDSGDHELVSHSHPSVNPGSTSATSWYYPTIPTTVATGNYKLIFVTDANLEVSESDEGNNELIKDISITGAPAPFKDLIVNSTNVPTTGDAGQTIWAYMTIKNEGNEASGVSTSKIYLSDDSIVDSGDHELVSHSHPSVNPGSTSATSWYYPTIPTTVATGNYKLIFVADANLEVSETDEGNNEFIKDISITGTESCSDGIKNQDETDVDCGGVCPPCPDFDLAINAFEITNFEYSTYPGETKSIYLVIKNIGTEVSVPTNVKIYLSDDATNSPDDLELTEISYAAINAGSTEADIEQVTIPSNYGSGLWYMNVVIQSSESNQSNNEDYFSFTIRPDMSWDLPLLVIID